LSEFERFQRVLCGPVGVGPVHRGFMTSTTSASQPVTENHVTDQLDGIRLKEMSVDAIIEVGWLIITHFLLFICRRQKLIPMLGLIFRIPNSDEMRAKVEGRLLCKQ